MEKLFEIQKFFQNLFFWKKNDDVKIHFYFKILFF